MTESSTGAALLEDAQAAIGVRFRRPELLELALRHASSSESRIDSNERLEFLGDAILGAVVCDRIFTLFPDTLEGEMTKIKSTAVSRRTCAAVAGRIGLADFMDLGKGMLMQARLPSSLAAGALEAVIGAVYLDQGYATARDFIVPHFDPVIERAASSGHHQNYKSLLQQHAQGVLNATPNYVVLEEKGPDHAKSFHIAVDLAGQRHEPAWGQSKKQAEQNAALHALHALGVIEHNEDGENVLAEPPPGQPHDADAVASG